MRLIDTLPLRVDGGGKWMFIFLPQVEHPQRSKKAVWHKLLSKQRKRAVVACFRMAPLYNLPRSEFFQCLKEINYLLEVTRGNVNLFQRRIEETYWFLKLICLLSSVECLCLFI
jgi:hypothetical protein